MDYAGLKAEIAKSSYQGMTDAEIVAAITAPAVGPSVKASLTSILDYLRTNNLWLSIKAAAGASPLNLGAVAAVDIFQDPHTAAIDLTIPAAQELLQLLVQSNVLTVQQADALTLMCQTTTTVAKTYGFDPAIHDMAQEILAARRWSAD